MTSELSAASAGGSGGASGVGLQNLVFGWSASALLAEEPLLVPLAAGAVVRVGAQTGFAVDDVAVLTDLGNMVFFQSKVGLRLLSAEDSPLAEALKQAVVQFRDGRVPKLVMTPVTSILAGTQSCCARTRRRPPRCLSTSPAQFDAWLLNPREPHSARN